MDFWHVSDYLAGAAPAIAPAQAVGWRHAQQGRLLANDRAGVLQALGFRSWNRRAKRLQQELLQRWAVVHAG